ncbi:MAG: sensor histidine kinase [Oscillospiraceae bacterium]
MLLQEEKELSRQASVLQILSNEYSSVHYIDLEDETAIPIRLSDASLNEYGLQLNHTYPFRKVYSSYIKSITAPDQVEEMLRFCDPDFLRQTLIGSGMTSYLYRIISEGKELYAQLRIARAENNDNFRHIVLGFAIVDDEVRAEKEKQRALQEALTQAKNASRAKTVFLNNMSHDIRTPMNAIIGFTNIALKQDNELSGY